MELLHWGPVQLKRKRLILTVCNRQEWLWKTITSYPSQKNPCGMRVNLREVVWYSRNSCLVKVTQIWMQESANVWIIVCNRSVIFQLQCFYNICIYAMWFLDTNVTNLTSHSCKGSSSSRCYFSTLACRLCQKNGTSPAGRRFGRLEKIIRDTLICSTHLEGNSAFQLILYYIYSDMFIFVRLVW